MVEGLQLRNFVTILLLLCLTVLNLSGQEADSAYMLNSAVVMGEKTYGTNDSRTFAVGSFSIASDSANLSRLEHSSLSRYINLYSPAYVREDGGGSSSSVALRGTNASHTSVMWNGVSMNSATMGQTNMNRMPLFFLDEVSVHAGGQSALYGNGSIGGSLQLKTGDAWSRGQQLEVLQTFGSFGGSFSGAKLSLGGKKLKSRTGLLYSQTANDFTFANYTKYGKPEEKQENAGYKNAGLQQEFYYKLSENSMLTSTTRAMKFNNDLQPMMAENGKRSTYTEIEDRLLHSLLSFNHASRLGRYTVTAGYLYDREDYRDTSKAYLIATTRLVGIAEAEKLLLPWFRVKAGANTDYIIPDVYAYRGGIKEWRNDLYMHFLLNAGTSFSASINLRQAFVTDLSIPFTPSVGLSYKLVNSSAHKLTLKAAVAKNVKVPSLNDRFWGSLGTTSELRPEHGKNIELATDYGLSYRWLDLKLSGAVYRNLVDDWIRWVPRGKEVKPENVAQVEASGVDAVLQARLNFGNLVAKIHAAYAYTKSTVKKEDSENDPRVGKQFIFQPYHRFTSALDVSHKTLTCGVGFSYVGERFGSDLNSPMKPYLLTDLLVEKQLKLKKHTLILVGRINNIADVSYESISYFAMPGRSWNVGLRYVFKS